MRPPSRIKVALGCAAAAVYWKNKRDVPRTLPPNSSELLLLGVKLRSPGRPILHAPARPRERGPRGRPGQTAVHERSWSGEPQEVRRATTTALLAEVWEHHATSCNCKPLACFARHLPLVCIPWRPIASSQGFQWTEAGKMARGATLRPGRALTFEHEPPAAREHPPATARRRLRAYADAGRRRSSCALSSLGRA